MVQPLNEFQETSQFYGHALGYGVSDPKSTEIREEKEHI